MEDEGPSSDVSKKSSNTKNGKILARYQEIWEKVIRLDDKTSDSYPLDKFDPENLSSGVQKIVLLDLENLAKKMENAAERESQSSSNVSEGQEPQSIPTHSSDVHTPSRYQQLWERANEVVDTNSSTYNLERYDPEGLSGGDWSDMIKQLYQILCIEDTEQEYYFNPSTEASMIALSQSEVVTSRLRDVVDTGITKNSIEGIVTDSEQLRSWLQVWARWNSLLKSQSIDREEIQISEIHRLDESTVRTLEQDKFKTLSAIHNINISTLREVDGIDKELASELQSWTCFRSTKSIQDVSPQIQQQLNNNRLWTAADLTAVRIHQVTNIEGISDQQARDIMKRAAAWLPPKSDLPKSIICQFGPPYKSLESAESRLDQLESLFTTYSEIEPLIEELETSPFDSFDKTTLINHIYEEYPKFTRHTGSTSKHRVPTWTDVLHGLLSLANQIDYEHPPSHIYDRFNISGLHSVEIEISTICEIETPSEALRRISSAEQIASRNKRFNQLSSHAANIQDSLGETTISGKKELSDAISNQVSIAHDQLVEGPSSEYLDQLEEYLTACQKALSLTENHTEYDFESLIPILAKKSRGSELPDKTIDEINSILTISMNALDLLTELDYNHPSIDRKIWKKSISTAVDERYSPILEPVDSELSRLNGGLWDPNDLEEYDWREFEYIVGDLYRDEGYEVEVTQSTADLGVDIWATDDGKKTAIQVKHFQAGNTVGREPLQKLVSTLAKGDADQVEIITSSKFTKTAKQYAEDFGPELTLTSSDDLINRLSESQIPPQS